jgi:hypothetical protein
MATRIRPTDADALARLLEEAQRLEARRDRLDALDDAPVRLQIDGVGEVVVADATLRATLLAYAREQLERVEASLDAQLAGKGVELDRPARPARSPRGAR